MHGLTWPTKRGHVAHAHVSTNKKREPSATTNKKILFFVKNRLNLN